MDPTKEWTFSKPCRECCLIFLVIIIIIDRNGKFASTLGPPSISNGFVE